MKKKRRSAFLLESLEARLLFSADLAPMPVDGGNSGIEVESGLEIALQPESGGVQAAETTGQEDREAIFVDEAVDDYQQLIDNIESQLEKGRQFDIVALDSDHDGIAQISAYLSQQQDVAAVHIISHGSDGEVMLGNSRLNATTLDGYVEAIEGWQGSLSGDADLLFYGCNLAAGDDGQELVNSLTLLTGADVAASDDVTGSVKFGGDWVLEYGKGEIETAVALNSAIQQSWNGVLDSFTVTTTADGVTGSLREAIMQANALGGANEITLNPGTYTLTLGELEITCDLTINGADARTTLIDGNGSDRVFKIDGNSTATLSGITVMNGAQNNSGGVFVENGSTLYLSDAIVRDNTSNMGGGIHVHGTANLERVLLYNNTAGEGGGIHFHNTAAGSLTNVTISNNSATSQGGGLWTNMPITVTNSTIAYNTAPSGGGIFDNDGFEITLSNSILYNSGSTNANQALTSGDFNIDSDGTAGLGLGGDRIADPFIAPLADNGGSIPTHALQAISVDAIDRVGLGGAPSLDGRGAARDGLPDIGAYEFNTKTTGAVDEFLVNDGHETGSQETSGDVDYSQRAVAVADDGSYVVVWSSDGQDTSGWGVYAQRFDKFGAALTGELRVNQIETGNEQWARVVSDGSGNFVVTWTSGHSGTIDVYARRFDSAGAALGGEFRVNTTTSNNQQDSSIAMDAFGNFVVVWEGQGSVDSAGVFYRRFQANGTAIDTTEMRANLTDDGTEQDASVAMNAAGDFVVVWEEGGRIKFQMFASDGTPGTASTVYIDTVSSNPDVAMDALGNFVVVYRWNGGSGQGVWAHQFDNTGTEQGTWWRVGPGNNTVNKDHTNPSITMDDDGNFIVTYESITDGEPGNKTVFAQKFQSDTTPLGGWFHVNQTTADDQHMASVAMLDLNNYVVAFTGVDTDQTGVFARQFGTAVNTAPTATNLTSTSVYNEGDASVPITNIVVSDTDTGETIKAMLTLVDTTTGSLSANDGASYDSGTGIWTITDTVANVNLALANLAFNPNVNNDVDTTISVVIDDGDEDLSGPLTGTITLDVMPVDITSDLIVHLEFSEGSGATAFDSTAYGNDAYLTGTQDWVGGTIGGGFHFDYSDGKDFFEINNAASVENLQEGSFTLAAWFKADDVPPLSDAYGIIVKEGMHTGVWYNSSKQIVFEHTLSGPSWPKVISTNTYDPGSYHHIAVTLDRPSGTITLYVDGVLENSSSFTPGAASWELFSETWKVGTARDASAPVDFPAKGSVDDVRIYSRAISAADAAALFDLGNRAPTITSAANTAATEDSAYSYTFTVNDVDVGDTITLSAPTLPGWLSFDPATGILAGTPTNAEVGDHTVVLRVNDGTVDVDQSFTITVANTNDAPTITSAANTAATEDSAYSYTFTVNDVDVGDTLTLSAPTLPGWLSFDPATGILAGTPTNAEVGDHTVVLRVNDGTVDVNQSFTITVANTNDAPTITSAANTAATEDSAYSYTFTVNDVDVGDTITLSAPTLPGWLSFDPATGILAGTPTNAEVGNHTVVLRVNDGTVDVDQSFTITVANTNDVPTISSTANTAATEDSAYSYTYTVNDVDVGDTITLSAPTLPGWLSFDPATGILAGTPTNAEVGDHTVVLRVNDGTVDVDQSFTITVANTNDAPTITSAANTAATEDSAYSYTFTVNDVDVGDTITLSAPTLPGWLSFDPATGILAGTPTNAEVGDHTVVLRVNDGTVDVDQSFTITVANTNDVPMISSTANTAATEDSAYSYTFTVNDVDVGDTITLSAPTLPGWLSFDPATGILSGTPTNAEVGNHAVVLRVNDGTVDVDQSFTITVANTNDAPTITSAANTAATEDSAYSYTFTVNDVDVGDTITLSAPTLPGWLSFDPATGILAGTPTNAEVGDHTVVLRVNDGTVDVDQNFTITVANTNDAPTITSAANTAATEDSAYSYTFTVNDVDVGDTLTLSAPTLPGWLSFDPATGILAGTPTNAEVGDHTVVLRVNDGTVDVNQSFTITVANTNDAPTITSAANTAATEDSAYSYTFAVNDDDVGDTLTLSAPTLPAWLSFDPATGILAGTPTNAEVGDHTVVLRVNDGTVDVDQNFTITVANTNDAGTVIIDNTTPTQGDTLTAGVTDADGASGAINYQWFSDGVAIGGATGKTYATTQADVGTIITVTAVYADDLGTAESLTSAGTAPVMNVNDTPVAVNDNLNAAEDQSITFTSVTDLLGNDSDIDGDTLTISGFTQPTNGMLADNADGTLTYTPVANFNGNDSFTYTISDGNGETATGTALIVIAPVGDTPQVTSATAISEVLSELIFINRNPSDGPEVTHFKISGITHGVLYLADGVTRIENGDYITVEQGQAGLKFIPAAGSTADGSFNVESSQDGVSVAPQSGIATSNITILTTAPSALEQSLPSSDPEPVVSEEAVPEESEVVEDVADEPDVQTHAGNLDPVEPLQSSKVPRTAKASLGHGVSFLKRADLDSNDDQTPDRSILLSPQTLKKLLEAEDLGELKTALKKLGITTLSPEDYELVRSSLDAIKEEIDRETLIGRTVLGSAIATSIGLSAGYVVWMLKGGSLLASVLSSLPAWQLADPLAILVGKKEDEDDDEDDSLKTIIAEGSGRDEGKKSRDSDLDNIRKESKKR